ncbi:MAG: hypothetical protein AABZ73_00860 [Pseudomonadota bacterium]|uniref:hypothetical protein n=1 Tax=Sphingobium sp. TaxID=1912891 RepID=UPI002E2492CA
MTEKRPSDLPTKWKRAPNGEMIAVKVVQSDSETLEYDLLAAFRSNVRRLKRERRERAKDADIAA